ncbi:MAG TPA: hypothetical protein VFY15_07300 [Acidimicrobiia bacterium]|nr:hypothetical protein [Acidimicrobiia bacterium]
MIRRIGTALGLVGLAVALPAPALAHGLGGRSDLPVPLEYFLVGALVVLLLSFGALAVLWPEPRLQDGPRWRGRGWRPGRVVTGTAAALGIGGLVLVLVAGLAGDPDARSNAAPVLVWVIAWLVLPFLAVIAGNLWAVLNPWATLGRLMGWSGSPGPGRYGVTPAAVALIALTWLELVYPHSGDPRTLGMAAAAYTIYLLMVSWRLGTERAVTSADLFTVYHRVLSAIAPFGRDPEGRIRRRGWLRALAVLPAWPGLTLFVVAMIGTVTYDGMSATPWWEDLTAAIGVSRDAMWFETVALVVTVALLGLLYVGACAWAGRIAGGGLSTTAVARSFAHTLVPIGLAYAFAHYFTLVAFEGQLLVAAISDPFGLGWDLFGTVDYRPNFTWIGPSVVWWVQLLAILGGHVSGVVLAHDRSLAVFPAARAVRSQYAMLGLMVALTTLGLTILAAG